MQFQKDFTQYYVVAFDPNKIYTHRTPQKNRLNLSFAKGIYIVPQKMTRSGKKWLFLKVKYFLQN